MKDSITNRPELIPTVDHVPTSGLIIGWGITAIGCTNKFTNTTRNVKDIDTEIFKTKLSFISEYDCNIEEIQLKPIFATN
jgi:hypothetical protein